MIKIYIEGAESTGKSTLAEYLAHYFGGKCLPEYGRIYLETHWGKIHYSDIETIAEMQRKLENLQDEANQKLLFVDVSLINTKHWFLHSFQKYPIWLDAEIIKYRQSYILLCEPDIPWIDDGLRKNDGELRLRLHESYKKSLIDNNIPFDLINGNDELRQDKAIKLVQNYLAKF